MQVIVLGGGLIGKHMAIDLAKDFKVTIADIKPKDDVSLPPEMNIAYLQTDLSQAENVKNAVHPFDIVVNAVPGFMGYQTVKSIIEAKKNIIDIAFSPENILELDQLAKDNGVVVISDIGVAPGMSNLLVGYADYLLDTTTAVKIYVGGLPKKRSWPFEYKAGFSPIDVIEEYTRPARVVENGEIVIKEALSEIEHLDFEKIGTLEAFNSDGLRSLLYTIDAPNMSEKTLRYPGHAELMKVFRHTGFFSQDSIEVNGTPVKIIDFTSKLLFPKWQLKEDEGEFTIMKIIVEGLSNGEKEIYTFDLYDENDIDSHTHSMARTTGYTATAALRMLAEHRYTKQGVSVPEHIGKHPQSVQFILKELHKRKVKFTMSSLQGTFMD